MEKFYIDSDQPNDFESNTTTKTAFDKLSDKIKLMNVFCEIEKRPNGAVVRVMDNAGTTEFFSKGTDDSQWLSDHCQRKERKGNYTLYYFKF